MENTRKSDVVAFCIASKVDLYNQLDRLDRGNFLSIQEQRNLILNMFKCLDLLESISDKNEQNIARINQAESVLKSVQSVENILQSTLYKFTMSWQ